MSLRTIHLIFILAAIVLVDMFGAWAVYTNAHSHERGLLAVGILSFVAGFALAGYVRKLDRKHIE
ncbi:MAG: hypothetical protein HYR83_00025 [Planctomycetes bacterium]|nr:hypothetical protein [Planctomycetota bacterium]